MKRKKIQYVSLESGAFISDLIFQAMTAAERGVYCTLIFYLYENNGKMPYDAELFNSLCNCEDFEKVWEFVKQKFIIKNGRIFHKRVSKELDRAKKLSQVQSEKGVKGMKSRWSKDNTAITEKSPLNNQAKESEAKGCEDKGRENIDTTSPVRDRTSTVPANRHQQQVSNATSVSAISKDLLPSAQNRQRSSIASQIQSLKSSIRLAPLEAPLRGTVGIDSRPLTGHAHDPTNMIVFHDRLANTFGGRTPADSTALRNLVRWVKDSVIAGVFTKGIYQRVLDMAVDSKNGNSRKPIAVFFAQVKRELGYKKDG
ncbi:MAG: YdaU family protein [Planctomycetes bacterium]|nr:YdaU family protein [Planctomycetota bacterium]